MIIDYVAIGKRIKKERRRRKISQEKFAELLNISPGYMSRVESGNAEVSLKLLLNISHQLNTNPGYFLTGVTYHADNETSHELIQLLKNCPPRKLDMIINIIKVINDY